MPAKHRTRYVQETRKTWEALVEVYDLHDDTIKQLPLKSDKPINRLDISVSKQLPLDVSLIDVLEVRKVTSVYRMTEREFFEKGEVTGYVVV